MEFILPSKYSERNTVLAKDKDVLIYSSKPGYYAAIRFGGYSNIRKVNLNNKIIFPQEDNFFLENL
jgi:hypothetical protein